MTETTALAVRSSYLPPPDRSEFEAMISMANSLAKAQGFLPAHFFGQPYKILAAILYGRDLGISATNALQHIIVIEGKATADAQLIGMLVRRAGHQMVDETTDQASKVTITRNDGTVHEATFTMQDAQRAGLVRAGGAWTKYPAAMLYARALTACARKGAQDALMGTVYTPEELGAEVDAEGVVIMPSGAPTGEIPSALALPESREALSVADDILGAIQNIPASPSDPVVASTATGTVAPQNGKRRGRPLGSKNKDAGPLRVGGVPDTQKAVVPVATSNHDPVNADIGGVAFGNDPVDALRMELRRLASRLRRYQYLEQAREVPSTVLWEAEVGRTLAIFIERKFGTDVALEDVEEAGLNEAITDLHGYLAKYEAPEDAIDTDSREQNPLEAAQSGQEPGPQGSASGGGEGIIDPPDQVPAMPTPAPGPGPSQGLQPTAQSAVAVSAMPSAGAQADATVVSLHKPIARNVVSAQRRGGEATQIDPQVSLKRTRALSDLRNRTTALLATKEGLVNLSSKDEDRLRLQADAVMERVAQNSFQRAIKDLDAHQLELLVERAKAATK